MERLIKEDGFSFSFDESKCKKCGGNCCIGESGYIWLSPKEKEGMAKFLDLNVDEFTKKYLTKVGYKYSIKEKSFNGGYACVFFDEKRLRCGVYEARPNQCRTFPFWDYFKTRIRELERECPGVML